MLHMRLPLHLRSLKHRSGRALPKDGIRSDTMQGCSEGAADGRAVLLAPGAAPLRADGAAAVASDPQRSAGRRLLGAIWDTFGLPALRADPGRDSSNGEAGKGGVECVADASMAGFGGAGVYCRKARANRALA